jgi:hypothetical protein
MFAQRAILRQFELLLTDDPLVDIAKTSGMLRAFRQMGNARI